VAGQSYNVSRREMDFAQLPTDVLGSLFGHQAVAGLGSTVVWSAPAARYAHLVGDPRISSWRDPDSVSPADLAELSVGRGALRQFDA
jgi:hypothetical protein